MNEQMEKLMYHAGLTASGCWDEMGDYEHRAIEKFAGLIVRECMDVVGKATASPNGYQALMKHFGVE
jgi:hypothetical protein